MKPLRFSREGTLKGFLLLALVANLTWEPLANSLSQMDLASAQAPVPAAPTAGRGDFCKDPKNKDHIACSTPESDRGAIVARDRQIRAEVAATGNRTSAKPEAGTTEAATTESCNAECQKQRADAKLKEQEATIAQLRDQLQRAGRTSTTVTTTTSDETAAADRPSQERIDNCEVDADGDKLDELDELKCQTKLLAKLKGREDSSRRREVSRRIEDLFKELRKDVKDNLTSKDADRRQKGEREVTELLAVIRSARFEKDSERTEMIESLEALRAGAEARTAAADLEEDVSDLEKEMRSSWRDLNKLTRDFQNSCRTRNGCDRDIYDQLQDQGARIEELKEEHYELAQTINEEQEDALDSLEDYRDSMSRSELRDYASPFAKLKSRMETMVDAKKLGASDVGNRTAVDAIPGRDSRVNGSGQAFLEENGLPDDFYSIRGGANASRRTNGIQVPQSQMVPMGSPQAIQTQIGQQTYVPGYMQPGMQMIPGQMMQGQSTSLLPPPGGMQMGRPMGAPGMMPGGAPRIMPVGGQQFGGQMMPVPGQQFGPQYGGSPQVMPVPR